MISDLSSELLNECNANLTKAIIKCKDITDFKNYSEGLTIFNNLIMSNLSTSFRIKSILTLSSFAPEQALDKIARIRDLIPFLGDVEEKTYDEKRLEREIQLLCNICEQPQINSHERLLCVICLFNNNYIDKCYPLFVHLLNDISVLIEYRIESARFLLYSDVEKYIKNAQDTILSIIDIKDYPSSYRYKTIVSFISTTGLATIINAERLNVSYDEHFLHKLQNKFFWNIENGIQERILSGQHILSMKSVEESEKDKIIEELLDIASNFTIEENINNEFVNLDDEDEEQNLNMREEFITNIKADAADVVSRLGNTEQKKRATTIIHNLGFSNINGKKIKNLVQKTKNAYNDKQNIHNTSINNSIQDFIKDKLLKIEDNEYIEPYSTVHSEISDLIYKSKLPPKNRTKAFKSLNRISIDTATFSKYELTSAEIFIYVWRLIKKHPDIEKEELKKRLLDELIEASDTCSSGHANRLINVLSGYDFELKISWDDQLKSNITGRMQSRIEKMKDKDLQELVLLGMADDSEPDQRDAYLKYIVDNVVSLKKELYEEFVENGYIKEEEFLKYFEIGIQELI